MSAKIFLVCLAAVSLGLASALPTGLDPATERVELMKSDDRLTPQEREMRTLLKLKLAKVAQFKPLLKEGHLGVEALGAGALLGSKFIEGEGNVGQYQRQQQHIPSSVRDEARAPLVHYEFQSQQAPALPPATVHESAPQIAEDFDSSPLPLATDPRIQSNPATDNPATRTKRDHKGNLKACAAGAGAFAATNGVATAVAPNPITAGVAAISGAIAAVCGIVENNS